MVDSKIFSKKYMKSKYCFVKGKGVREGEKEINYKWLFTGNRCKNQLLINWTTLLISNHSRTKTDSKVTAWLLSTPN